MEDDKALGPDGFTLVFWQFVKAKIMELFRDFFVFETFTRSLNTTFLVPIPKKGDAEDLKDFRPISMLGSLYKILAKVLATITKKGLWAVLSRMLQMPLWRGWQILNASLIANEVIDSWQKRKDKGVVCKLDIEKVFDSINWQFLMKAWALAPNG